MERKVFRILSFILCLCLVCEQPGFCQEALSLETAGRAAGVHPASETVLRPPHLRAISFDPAAGSFRVLVDKGDEKGRQQMQPPAATLLDYFLIGLTLPDDTFWVNLRPDSPDNVIDPALARTDVGRILLEADVQLKKDVSAATSPDTRQGKLYWDRLYKKAEELLGSQDITIPTLSRPWIVPGEVIIRETKGNAYIYKATLKVRLEQDRLDGSAQYDFSDGRMKQLNDYASQLVRELILPAVVKRVNTSPRYAALRQVYYSLILAQWFKSRLANANAPRPGFIDSKDLAGLTSKSAWSVAPYFEEYRRSFSNGEYNTSATVTAANGRVSRSYSSGGLSLVHMVAPPNGSFSEGVTDLRAIAGTEGVVLSLPAGQGEGAEFDGARVSMREWGAARDGGAVRAGPGTGMWKPLEERAGSLDAAAARIKGNAAERVDVERELRWGLPGEESRSERGHLVGLERIRLERLAAQETISESEGKPLYLRFLPSEFKARAEARRDVERLRQEETALSNEAAQARERFSRRREELESRRDRLEREYSEAAQEYVSAVAGMGGQIEEARRRMESRLPADLYRQFDEYLIERVVLPQLETLAGEGKLTRADIDEYLALVREQLAQGTQAAYTGWQGDGQLQEQTLRRRRALEEFKSRKGLYSELERIEDSVGFNVLSPDKTYASLVQLFFEAESHTFFQTLFEQMEGMPEELRRTVRQRLEAAAPGVRERLDDSTEAGNAANRYFGEKDARVRWAALKNNPLINEIFGAGAAESVEKAAAEVTLRKLLGTPSHTDRSVQLGYILFWLAEENLGLRVELAPLLILNAFRESGYSGEMPFISIHRSLSESELYKFCASLSEQDIARLSPGVREAARLIRAYPDTFYRDLREEDGREITGQRLAMAGLLLQQCLPMLKDDSAAQRSFAFELMGMLHEAELTREMCGELEAILLDPAVSGELKQRLLDMVRHRIWEASSHGQFYRFLERLFTVPALRAEVAAAGAEAELLKSVSDATVSRILKVNVKVARYLKGLADTQRMKDALKRLEDPAFRDTINNIAYNLNREVTLHPAERRVGEDEKASLFTYLFSMDREQLAAAETMFNAYFRNEPSRYTVEIGKLVELLSYLSLEDIGKLIRTVEDNPKQSLQEIIDVVKQQVQGRENAEFIIRDMEWILSNLFVLQYKIELLAPLAASLQAGGKGAQELVQLLTATDKAKKAQELLAVAQQYGVDAADLLKLKMESLGQPAREELLVNFFQMLDPLPEGETKQELSAELSLQFACQAQESRTRIFFKLLLSLNMDNAVMAQVIAGLLSDREPATARKSVLLRAFLFESRNVLKDNAAFQEYVAAVSALEGAEGKEAWKALRSLYQDRRYSSKGLSAGVAAMLEGLARQTGQAAAERSIPHVLYEPLLTLVMQGAGMESLQAVREHIAALNADRAVRDQLAGLKNRLSEKIILFSGLTYASVGELFAAVSRAAKTYDEYMLLLEQYLQVADIFNKASILGAFSPDLNTSLTRLSGGILSAMMRNGTVDREGIARLSRMIAGIDSELLLARFRRFPALQQGRDAAELEALLKGYSTDNPRFKWTDHEGRNIYRLMDLFLNTIEDEEIYRNMLDAIVAETRGEFRAFKYSSADYLATLDAVAHLAVARLPAAEQEKLLTLLAGAAGDTFCDKLLSIPGYEGLKAVIGRMRGWEGNLRRELNDGLTAVFTDDFYTLFTIGDSRHFMACQSCAYGSNLNRGLSGYVANGTNKAVAILDSEGRVVARRIVRLRIFTDGQGMPFPGLFVEESTQFGSTGIDELYALLDEMSRKTGLPVVKSTSRPADSAAVRQGSPAQVTLRLFKGRSTFDYSDMYGSLMPGKITAGLFQQTENELSTQSYGVLVKPAADPLLDAPGGYAGARDGGAADTRKGGIDFRQIPVVSAAAAAVPGLSPQETARLAAIDTDAEWRRIEKLLQGGIAPSGSRLRECVLAGRVRNTLAGDLDKVLGCIAAAMRLEEQQVTDTDGPMREALALAEPGN